MSKDTDSSKSKIRDFLQKNVSQSMKYSYGDHQILPYTKGAADKSKMHLRRSRQKTKMEDERDTSV